MNRQQMSDAALELIANRFKALSEPTRLKLIIALEQGEKNVTELVELTNSTQPNISRQLQTLADEGIIARRKEGVTVYYRVADPAIFELCDHVCGSVQKHLAARARTFKGAL